MIVDNQIFSESITSLSKSIKMVVLFKTNLINIIFTHIFNIFPAAKESAKEIATKNKADSDDDDDDNESRKGNGIFNLFKL